MSEGRWLWLDAGNSRVKWLISPLDGDEIAHLDAQTGMPPTELIAQCVGAAWISVAASGTSHALSQALRLGLDRDAPLIRHTASSACGPLRNVYLAPEQLGADRWAAAAGAYWLAPHREAVVVSAGTATTIDHLSAQGVFNGGVILPGLTMMVDALHQGTAALPRAKGQAIQHPLCTDDAIVSGVARAQWGAIQQCVRDWGQAQTPALWMTGGAASALEIFAHALGYPKIWEYRPSLVLEGVRALTMWSLGGRA